MTLLSPPRTHEHEIDEPVQPAEPTPELTETETPAGPAEHEIATEAYTRYLLRGCKDGHALEDWLEAERSLREKYSYPPPRN